MAGTVFGHLAFGFLFGVGFALATWLLGKILK